MTCRYNDFNGKCQLYDGTIEMPCSEEGYCLCEDDEYPENACEDYQE